MDAAIPPSHAQAGLYALSHELTVMRDLLVKLSLELHDMQFEADPELRAKAILQTDQLMAAFQAPPK